MTAPDLVTADDLNVGLCTIDGADHDWRPCCRKALGLPPRWQP
jgi:hypothetical protein